MNIPTAFKRGRCLLRNRRPGGAESPYLAPDGTFDQAKLQTRLVIPRTRAGAARKEPAASTPAAASLPRMRRLALVGAALVEVALGASPRLRGARVLGAGEAEECVLDCVAGTCVAREGCISTTELGSITHAPHADPLARPEVF